jgi:hypothetical protein
LASRASAAGSDEVACSVLEATGSDEMTEALEATGYPKTSFISAKADKIYKGK